ncbi:MAG: hypothetical protein HYT70_03530 [Candidatus Aenigmarchaeota archaeon]|nr:hypothetical protein [Candidatus Aenigmarchaeota archaeon]
MQEVLEELRKYKLYIEDEHAGGRHDILDRIAADYGYRFVGTGTEEFLGADRLNIVFFGRKSSYSKEAMQRLVERLNSENYQATDVYRIGDITGYFKIVKKRYEERGAVGLLDRDARSLPIVVWGYSGSEAIIGLMPDIGAEHIGLLENMADVLGMEPRKKSEREDFDRLLEGINLDL